MCYSHTVEYYHALKRIKSWCVQWKMYRGKKKRLRDMSLIQSQNHYICWRDGSVVNQGPEFNSQHPHGGSLLSITPVPGHQIPLWISKFSYRYAVHIHTEYNKERFLKIMVGHAYDQYIHTYTYIHASISSTKLIYEHRLKLGTMSPMLHYAWTQGSAKPSLPSWTHTRGGCEPKPPSLNCFCQVLSSEWCNSD